jgi:hypothetical protein
MVLEQQQRRWNPPTNQILKEDIDMSELVRANKVTVKTNEDGRYVAEFYRTHKKISTITDAETGWEKPVDFTKTGERESFRAYVINNAGVFGILWKPEDMRDSSNVRLPKYSEDAVLMAEAVTMVTPDITEIISKCKYDIKLMSIDPERIIPKTKTGKGIPLSGLGIVGGKYEKSGNWAWADIEVSTTMEYKGEEIYYTAMVELVSGQLKKPKLMITSFNEYIKNEIISAGLATAEELDPPKESKPTEESAPEEGITEEGVAEEHNGNWLPGGCEESEFVDEPKLEVDEVIAQDTQDAPQEEVVNNKSGRRRTLGKNK